MITIVDLYKKFNSQWVTKGVNLTIPTGEITCIIGRSGEGKSVLLKQIIGLIKPTSGDIIIDNVIERVTNEIPDYRVSFSPEPYRIGASWHPCVTLLKLHGSIDWRETPYDAPNIIPPTWSKRIDRYGKYHHIWNSYSSINVFQLKLHVY